MKKTQSLLFLFVLLSFFGFASAQELTPSVSVTNVTLDKSEYTAGETIRGTFEIENHSSFDVHDLSFRAQVGADYEEPLPNYRYPRSFLDAGDRQGAISLAKGEAETVAFTYRIPSFIQGEKLGININIYSEAGTIIGLGDSQYMSVKNSGIALETKSVSLVLSDGSRFGLTEGPTIYKDKEPRLAYVEVEATNKSKEEIEIRPKITAYEQKDPKSAKTSSGGSFTIKPGATDTIKIALPDQGFKPGVYFAEILLLDFSGAQLESRIGARYIVGGNIATVHSASASKGVLAQNEKFTFEATLSGRPLDINLAREAGGAGLPDDDAVGKTEIRIYNEKNELVASATDDFYLSGDTYTSLDLYAANPGEALRVEMDVSDDKGALLTSYRQNLSADYDAKAQNAPKSVTSFFGGEKFMKIALLALALLALIIIIVLMLRRKNNITNITAMFLLLAIVSFAGTDHAEAAKRKAGRGGGGGGGCGPASVSITPTAPYYNQKFAPGVLFYAGGSVTYTSCDNSSTNLTITVSGPSGETKVDTSIGVGPRGGHGWTGGNQGFFHLGPFRAPATAGTYYVNFNVHSQAGICGTDASAQVPIIVEAQPNGSGGSGGGGGCPAGTYYCEVSGACTPNGQGCLPPSYVPIFKVNPNIPAKIGPVKLKGLLKARPPLVNPGDKCVVSWQDEFTSYDQLTVCTFSWPKREVQFSPGDASAPTSAEETISKDTPFKMVCRESDGFGEESTSEGICRINVNYKEVN